MTYKDLTAIARRASLRFPSAGPQMVADDELYRFRGFRGQVGWRGGCKKEVKNDYDRDVYHGEIIANEFLLYGRTNLSNACC